MSVSMILFEEDAARLGALCAQLNREACARAVFLVDRDGQLIASAGAVQDFDSMSLASLTAGNVAATNGLAGLLGEQGFDSQFHKGVREHIFISALGARMILVVIFNERSSLGLVRLKIDQSSATFDAIIDQILSRSGAMSTNPVGYTESEIAEMLDDE